MMSRLLAPIRALFRLPLRLIQAPFAGFSTAVQTDDSVFDPEEPYQMSFDDFMANLRELRSHVFKAAIALVIGTVIGFALAGPGLDYLRQPYCNAIPPDVPCRLVSLGPTGSIVVYFRVSLLIGGMIAIPVITYQFLSFIMVGLKNNERRIIFYSLPPITILFLLGAAFAWFVLMPPAITFLEGFQSDIFSPEWTGDLYLSFVTALIFWMGVAFETPLVFFVLGLMGMVTPRALVQSWRLAVIAAAVAAAFITPTIDPVNMFLVMGPLLALYVLSIFLVVLAQRFAKLRT